MPLFENIATAKLDTRFTGAGLTGFIKEGARKLVATVPTGPKKPSPIEYFVFGGVGVLFIVMLFVLMKKYGR